MTKNYILSNKTVPGSKGKPVGVLTAAYLEGIHRKLFILVMLGLVILCVGVAAISQGGL
jgi:hypothetical protein